MKFGLNNLLTFAKSYFKLFNFLSLLLLITHANAIEFQQEKNSKFMRWLIKISKDQIIVTKSENWVLLETFELSIFEKLKTSLENANVDQNYFTSYKFTKDYFPERPAQIQIFLKDNSVELFKFFRPEDQQLVLDFWINSDVMVTKTQKPETTNENIEKIMEEPPKKIVEKKEVAFVPQASIDKVTSWNSGVTDSKSGYRDFRYGATLIWPHKAIIPNHEVDIQLSSKNPDFYLPIKTPNAVKDERETVLQLILNFYKKEKYGLMKKTMDLFNQKYTASNEEKIFFTYIEANTLFKSSLGGSSASLIQGAMGRLEEILKLSKDYDYQKISYRFLIQYALNKENFQKSLELAKDFYIRTNENRDKEMIYLSTKVILYSLAQLNQVDKLDQFLNDSYVSKWLDTQEGISYKIYSLFKRNEFQKLLATYERLEKSLSKPIEASINYHVAESYFQLGELEKSQKYYNEFINHHSFRSQASFARVRKALISELLEEPVGQTIGYYLEAIDKATMPQARIEAKFRYVGLAHNRKQVATEGDKMILGFLDVKDDERPWIVGDTQLLLWQTRLRSFIKTGNYSDALTYLSTLPVDSMTPIFKNMFEADGTEIVLGIMQQAHMNGDHAKVVKIWGIYQNKMGSLLKNNKQALYYAGTSALRVGLKTNSANILSDYKTAKDQYPQWVKRDYSIIEDESVIARQLTESKKWTELEEHLKTYKNKDAIFIWSKAQLLLSKNNFTEAKTLIEEALTDKATIKSAAPVEMNDLLEMYLTCLENVETGERLQKRIEAIIAVMNPKNEIFHDVRERAKFLLLESYYKEKNKSLAEVNVYIDEFQKYYPESTYLPRIKYGKALYYFSQKNSDEGTKILNEIIENKKTPTHIREMAKSELSSIAVP